MQRYSLATIPYPLETYLDAEWTAAGDQLQATAPPRSDLFVDPFGAAPLLNAPLLLFPVRDDFLLSARVTVKFGATFDAGVMVVYQNETSWAKLCFEYSPQRRPMVVSVVTKGLSDDCNSVEIDSPSIYLRIGKRGRGWVFHYSEDGRYWKLVRAFSLATSPTRAGFLVQSPTGAGCKVKFEAIQYQATALEDFRSGE